MLPTGFAEVSPVLYLALLNYALAHFDQKERVLSEHFPGSLSILRRGVW